MSDKKKCHWWNHPWGGWNDVSRYKIRRGIQGDVVIGEGIAQERRCTHCNKVQLRTVEAMV